MMMKIKVSIDADKFAEIYLSGNIWLIHLSYLICKTIRFVMNILA